MRNFLDSMLAKLKEFFGGLEKKQKRRLFVLTLLILVLSVAAALLLGRTTYAVLYEGLSASEAGRILTALEEMGVDARPQGTDTILVPKERLSELWMRLSADGYNSDDIDYSVYAMGNTWGATDLDKQTYLKYQIETHLRQSILKLEKIQDCLVMITLPKESAFVLSANTQPAQAVVTLVVKNGVALTQAEAATIAEMVAMGVPGLQPENITISDSKMNLYKPANGQEVDVGTGVATQLALEKQVREELETQVTKLLAPVFGLDSMRTTVNVSLNFDTETIQSVVFEPPVADQNTGIIVSMQELYENVRDGEYAMGVPGTDSNGMGNPEYPYDGMDEDDYYSKILREMNYEVNETRSQIEKAKGTVRTLTIAVLLDSEAVSEDYTEDVRELVAMTVGVKEDHVSVQRLPFQVNTDVIDEQVKAQREFITSMETRAMITEIVKYVLVFLLALCVLGMALTIVRAVVGVKEGSGRLVLAEGPDGGVDYLIGDDGEDEDGARDADIDLKSKSDGLQQIEKFIDKDPDAVAQLLRNWLSDD